MTIEHVGQATAATAKRIISHGIRMGHRLLASRPLPDALAIYFHPLERQDHAAFRACIRFLKDLGYVPGDAHAFQIGNSHSKRLFVSFDDNFASWHSALGLLEELQLMATFYVNTLPFRDLCSESDVSQFFDRIVHHGERLSLTQSQLREIHAAGHTIGCHTHSHYCLTDLPRHKWDVEIRRSKEILEDLLGAEVRDFSYPYGMRRYFSADLAAYCFDVGFQTIATGIPGLQHVRPNDPRIIHRTRWNLDKSLEHNIADLEIDGRLFERFTGRSAVA